MAGRPSPPKGGWETPGAGYRGYAAARPGGAENKGHEVSFILAFYLEETSHRTSVLRRDLLTMGQMDLEGLVSLVIPRRVRMDYELLSDPVEVQAVSQGNPPPGGHRICSAGQSRAWEGLRHLLCLRLGGRQALNHSWPSADGCRSPRRSGRAWHSTCRSFLELLLLLSTRVWQG